MSRNWLLALGPVIAAIVGALTNLITSTWNWWFFAILVALVGVASLVVVVSEAWLGPSKVEQPGVAGGSTEQSAAERTPATLWLDVPPRSPHFTGRADLLRQLDEQLTHGEGVAALVPHALHGLGGVGKTHLAIEYAVRHADAYDLVAWFPAEQANLVRGAYLRLAERMGIPRTDDATRDIDAVLEALRRGEPYRRWLLIFDNAAGPESMRGYLPVQVPSQSTGQILVTSRDRTWERVARAVEVDVLRRSDSIALVRRRLPQVAEPDARRLADQLGDLPLALEQATAWISSTGSSAHDYVALLDERIQDLLRANKPTDYPLSVAATLDVALEALSSTDAAAVRLLELCAFFGPEPISRELLRFAPPHVTASCELDGALADPLVLAGAFAHIGQLSLAKIDGQRHTLQLHRLVRAYLRHRLSGPTLAATRTWAQQVLVAAVANVDDDFPIDGAELELVAPHFVAAGCLESEDATVRDVVVNQAAYRFYRGDPFACRSICEPALEQWTPRLDPYDRQIIRMRQLLGDALRWVGETHQARSLAEDTLERARRSFGPDDPLTLRLAISLASDLRLAAEYRRAWDLDNTTLATYLAILPKTHFRVTTARNNLAINLRFLGRFAEALALDDENTAVCHAAFGADHWRTLVARAAAACDHYYLGDYHLAYNTLAEAFNSIPEHARGPVGIGQRRGAAPYIGVTWQRWHAILLSKTGRTEEAQAVGHEALDAYLTTFSGALGETAVMKMSLANVTRPTDPHHAAILAAEALDDHVRILGVTHPTTGAAFSNAALATRAAGNNDHVREHSRQGYEILAGHFGPDHWATLCAQINLASALAFDGDHIAARRLSEEAYERSVQTQGVRHPNTQACAHNLALDLHATGDRKPARLLRATALATMTEQLGSNHLMTVSTRAGRRLDCDIEVTTF